MKDGGFVLFKADRAAHGGARRVVHRAPSCAFAC
jgi:hypothetical protein